MQMSEACEGDSFEGGVRLIRARSCLSKVAMRTNDFLVLFRW